MNDRMPDIYKAGAVLIRDRKLLLTRSKGKDVFVAPGGKLEYIGTRLETGEEAVARELEEELQITVIPSQLVSLGVFQAIAAGHEADQKIVQMEVFFVGGYTGNPTPSSEIEELVWVNTLTDKPLMGSIFEHEVLPLLKERNLID